MRMKIIFVINDSEACAMYHEYTGEKKAVTVGLLL